MSGWIECVPNFSEGRDGAIIHALESAIERVPGAHLLDVHADPSHHRSVLTLAGASEPVAEAVFHAARTAVEHIDLATHSGEHPRMGAVDVIPFVPLDDTTVEECVAVARALAERLGRDLDIPVVLYGEAATAPDHRHLPTIRRRAVEVMRSPRSHDARFRGDFGPEHLHQSAGATAVGVRPFLVAFNIYLETDDVRIARDIAATIRTSNDGLPALQAKGFSVAGRAQVSMNLVDVAVTTPQSAFDAVDRMARERGVDVAISEIVGLVPGVAVAESTTESLRLSSPLHERLLEPRLDAARSA